MKKSYHSIVVPIVDAMTALRSCALCSDPDNVSYVVALAIGVLLQPAPPLSGTDFAASHTGNSLAGTPFQAIRVTGSPVLPEGSDASIMPGVAFEKPVSCRGFHLGRGQTRVSEGQG